MNLFKCTLVLSMLLLQYALVCPAQAQIAAVVPFVEDAHNHAIITASVDGVSLHLLVDTCARSTLSQTSVKKINLRVEANGKASASDTYVAEDLIFGDLHDGNITFAVCKDSVLANVSDDIAIDGILGIDVLEDFRLGLNFSKHELTFAAPVHFQPAADSHRVALEHPATGSRQRYFQVQCELVGRKKATVPLLLDMGAESVYLPAKLKTKDLSILSQISGNRSITMRGQYTSTMYRLPSLKIGDLTLTNIVADQLAPDKFINEGLLGMDILRRFFVTIDFPHLALYLEPDPNFHEDDSAYIGIGIGVVKEGTNCVVQVVVRPSPVYEVKIQVGDVLTAINGKPTQNMSLDEIYACWKSVGAEVHLQIQRKGISKPREVSLTVRKLL